MYPRWLQRQRAATVQAFAPRASLYNLQLGPCQFCTRALLTLCHSFVHYAWQYHQFNTGRCAFLAKAQLCRPRPKDMDANIRRHHVRCRYDPPNMSHNLSKDDKCGAVVG